MTQGKALRRKLISKLLQIKGPIEADALRRLLLDDDSKEAVTARMVLAAALSASLAAGINDPDQVYRDICEVTPAQLAERIADTSARSFSGDQITQAQARLKDELTSKAGRPATGSPEVRKAQLAAAQARRREKLAIEQGRKQVNEYISADAAARLAHIQQIHGKSRAEALELILGHDVIDSLLTALAAN